jgi:hypothetical protein
MAAVSMARSIQERGARRLRPRWGVREDGTYFGVLVDGSVSPALRVWSCDHVHYSSLGEDPGIFDAPEFRSAKACAVAELERRAGFCS